MYRGTTPILEIKINFDTSLIEEVYATFMQKKEVVFEKQATDCGMNGDTISIPLTQEETLSLNEGALVVQLRAKLKDGSALATDPVSILVKDVFKDGEI